MFLRICLGGTRWSKTTGRSSSGVVVQKPRNLTAILGGLKKENGFPGLSASFEVKHKESFMKTVGRQKTSKMKVLFG